MNYESYKSAANRHLNTVLVLREHVENTFIGKTLSNTEEIRRDEMLSNMYYLCGYCLECILSYSIVHYVIKVDVDFRKKIAKKKRITVDEVSVRELVVADNNCNVSFSTGSKYVLYRPSHKFQKNIDFFVHENKISGIDSIRGINGKTIPQPNVRSLYNLWNAEVRYSTSDFLTLLTPADIFDFADFTNEVFNGITQKILPKYA